MQDCGASQTEVIATIRFGRREPAQRGRGSYRRSIGYNALWNGRHYATKPVLAIVAERSDRLIVVTIYTDYS